MIRKIFKVTLLLLLVAVCGVGYLGWSRVKNSRLDLDDVELMADPEAALEVDPDILDEIARRKTAGAEEAVQVLNQEETDPFSLKRERYTDCWDAMVPVRLHCSTVSVRR